MCCKGMRSLPHGVCTDLWVFTFISLKLDLFLNLRGHVPSCEQTFCLL